MQFTLLVPVVFIEVHTDKYICIPKRHLHGPSCSITKIF